jgi:hypothetical protein
MLVAEVAQGPLSGPAARSGFSIGVKLRDLNPVAANTTIQLSIARISKTTARWKCRKAGERALRYIFIPLLN